MMLKCGRIVLLDDYNLILHLVRSCWLGGYSFGTLEESMTRVIFSFWGAKENLGKILDCGLGLGVFIEFFGGL